MHGDLTCRPLNTVECVTADGMGTVSVSYNDVMHNDVRDPTWDMLTGFMDRCSFATTMRVTSASTYRNTIMTVVMSPHGALPLEHLRAVRGTFALKQNRIYMCFPVGVPMPKPVIVGTGGGDDNGSSVTRVIKYIASYVGYFRPKEHGEGSLDTK